MYVHTYCATNAHLRYMYVHIYTPSVIRLLPFLPQFVSSTLVWALLHFLFWDQRDTKEGEELTPATLVAYFSNPDAAVFNQMFLLATVCMYIPRYILTVHIDQ